MLPSITYESVTFHRFSFMGLDVLAKLGVVFKNNVIFSRIILKNNIYGSIQ